MDIRWEGHERHSGWEGGGRAGKGREVGVSVKDEKNTIKASV